MRLPAGGAAGASYVLDAHSGALVATHPLPAGVSRIVPTDWHVADGRAEQAAFLLVSTRAGSDAPPTVSLLPDTPATRGEFAARAASTYFWQADEAAGRLVGYGFDGAAAAAAAPGASVPAVQVWSVQLPEPIVALATRDPRDPSHSYVKVRTIEQRWLRPATAAHVCRSTFHRGMFRCIMPPCQNPPLFILCLDDATLNRANDSPRSRRDRRVAGVASPLCPYPRVPSIHP